MRRYEFGKKWRCRASFFFATKAPVAFTHQQRLLTTFWGTFFSNKCQDLMLLAFLLTGVKDHSRIIELALEPKFISSTFIFVSSISSSQRVPVQGGQFLQKRFGKPGHVGNLGGSVFFVGDHFGIWMNIGWTIPWDGIVNRHSGRGETHQPNSMSLYNHYPIIRIPVVPGQAGGGSFQKEKN